MYGGPVVLIWSWLITGSFTVVVGVAMAELSSSFPVSGGLYYWAFTVGHTFGPLASYVVGWLNLLGQVNIPPSLSLALGYWQSILICVMLQVAFVAGNTFTVVSFLTAALFLVTKELCNHAYYPSNSMVRTKSADEVLVHI